MISFIALYRGRTVAGATLVAVTGDPTLVAAVATKLHAERESTPPDDQALQQISAGKRAALRLIEREVGNGE